VQQLREGIANFFVTFIEVLEDRRDLRSKWKPRSPAAIFFPVFYKVRGARFMRI